ncbi:MAG: class I SAM-dependent methyltransferase [Deltaproteobacteria bacterium]|nr:class I SAM-dependent methyltransferase [Deltaproteobacteria bacterium]
MLTSFPRELLLNSPERRHELVQKFYEHHHQSKRDISLAKGEKIKLDFYKNQLEEHGHFFDLCIDFGCRGGTITQGLMSFGNWVGVDIDRNAIELAESRGIPCVESDISVSLDFKDESFDAICMTEVLEHLPYPSITLAEVWRVIKKNPKSVFLGSIPLDYHFRRRWQVMRGKGVSKDPTHLRSFSFQDIQTLLNSYFESVTFFPVRGLKVKYPLLSWNHFVSDVAWFAKAPRPKPQNYYLKLQL